MPEKHENSWSFDGHATGRPRHFASRSACAAGSRTWSPKGLSHRRAQPLVLTQ
jgi:hypothetical protein